VICARPPPPGRPGRCGPGYVPAWHVRAALGDAPGRAAKTAPRYRRNARRSGIRLPLRRPAATVLGPGGPLDILAKSRMTPIETAESEKVALTAITA
jgi:hypothetical protein